MTTARHSTSRWTARAAFAVSVFLTLGIGVLFALLELDASYEPVDSLASGPARHPHGLVLRGRRRARHPEATRRTSSAGRSRSPASGSSLGGVLGAYARVALLAKPEAGFPAGAAAAVVSGRRLDAADGRRLPPAPLFPAGHLPSRALAPVARRSSCSASRSSGWSSRRRPATLDAPVRGLSRTRSRVTSSESYLVAIFAFIAVCLLSRRASGRRPRPARSGGHAGRSGSSSSGSPAAPGCCSRRCLRGRTSTAPGVAGCPSRSR